MIYAGIVINEKDSFSVVKALAGAVYIDRRCVYDYP